jgi:catechol 2,3-dioxygenase-like lactoylglutathione lyase family enzyme
MGFMAQASTEALLKITLASITVNDQDKALKFYTEVLGFVKKTELPMGEAKWLTVVSPEGSADIELVLEPNTHPAARTYQRAIFEDGIPATSFASADVHEDYDRLTRHGVVFRTQPTRTGPVIVAVLDDTCGNLIQIHQV